MKKAFAIFLLSLFLIHFSGFYIFFAVRMMAIRTEIRERLKALPEDQFEIIQLSASDYQKSGTDENEIEWHGKRYDIGRMKVLGDQLTLYVIHDKAEDNLLSFLDEIIKRSEGDSCKTPVQVLAFIYLIFVPIENNFCFNQVISSDQISLYSEHLYSVTLPIESPPPQGA